MPKQCSPGESHNSLDNSLILMITGTVITPSHELLLHCIVHKVIPAFACFRGSWNFPITLYAMLSFSKGRFTAGLYICNRTSVSHFPVIHMYIKSPRLAASMNLIERSPLPRSHGSFYNIMCTLKFLLPCVTLAILIQHCIITSWLHF